MSSDTITGRPTEVDFEENKPENVVDAYRHADGSITYIVVDEDGFHANPREFDGNIATLIQENDRRGDVDTDDEHLSEARDHFFDYGPRHGGPRPGWKRKGWGSEEMVRRYISIYRPEIVYYTDRWSAGELYGWGYVTRTSWEEAMGEGYTGDITPEYAFDQEVSVYRQWADGEVYGSIHVSIGDPIVRFWDHGAYIDGYTIEEDSCWGHLGYDDHKDIATQYTNSPITEVLA